MTDGLSTRYQDLLDGSYDCVDRIVLNAYFRMGHSPGGFRVWWRALTGSDETLQNSHLMRLAGRFSRRIRGYAKAHGIPVIDCSAGQRKHDQTEPTAVWLPPRRLVRTAAERFKGDDRTPRAARQSDQTPTRGRSATPPNPRRAQPKTHRRPLPSPTTCHERRLP